MNTKVNLMTLTLAITFVGGQYAFAQTTTSSPEQAATSQDASPAPPTPSPQTQPPDTKAAADNPVALDRTGINWAMPFSSAKSTAIEANRLLMIKPVAFGTKPDGGW